MSHEILKKMLGDAGEHYAVSQFGFHGLRAHKMPDGWPGHDVAVDANGQVLKVSVKTRSETPSFGPGSWFLVPESKEVEWSVFVFVSKEGIIRSWCVPSSVVQAAGRPYNGASRVSYASLWKPPLSSYEGNWSLSPSGTKI